MKRLHAGAKSRKHGCSRCGKHKSKIIDYIAKTGRKFCLCVDCAKATGKLQ